MKRLFFLELNELNFDVVKSYLREGESLPGFRKLFEKKGISTLAESDYDSLEPWIQWPSVHTGKKFQEHNIFRLGDIVSSSAEQFFEKVEKANYSVGAISPMNAANRLKKPTYFIPDPWTQTSSDGSFFSKIITNAIVQAVNDNSQSKLSIKTIIGLLVAFLVLVSPLNWFSMTKYAFSAIRKPWRKALFLDKFLHEIHKTLFFKKKPNFSTLFLNAGAHIQHHYFFNSPFVKSHNLVNPSWYINQHIDPFKEMLKVYDKILVDIFNFKNTDFIIATGLSQKPYEKLKFYYRIKNHNLFLQKIGIKFTSVIPRMTRDFLICFDSKEQAKNAEKKLANIKVNNQINLFEKIDNRGNDIFVVLTYPFEITNKTSIFLDEKKFLLKEFVSFVAIKNGEHQNKGFAFFSEGIRKYSPLDKSHVSEVHNTVLNYFGIKN